MVDPEAEANWLLRNARSDAPGARSLIRAHLGPGAIVRLRGLAGVDAALSYVRGVPRIAIRRGLPSERERWALLHELAEWHLAEIGYEEPDVELVAEAITAALVLPRGAFRGALVEHGERFGQLARAFMTTPTAAALRLGEVTGRPLAVVAPTGVRVRGDNWGWPSAPEIAQLAKARRLPRGVVRRRLPQPRRCALMAS